MIEKQVKISEIKRNPANPRVIRDEKYTKLLNSLLVFPKMLQARPIVVDKQMVVLGGNMRLKALQEIATFDNDELFARLQKINEWKEKDKSEQTEIFDYWLDFTTTKKLNVAIADDFTDKEASAFIIKDNNNFGEWDYELLNNWDSELLEDWGMETPEDWGVDNEIEDGDEEEETNEEEINEEAEILLNKAMQQYCGEFKMQIDALEKTGYIFSGLTEGFAKIKFLYAYYYGKRYPRYCSLVFNPEQFKTNANTRSVYDQLQISAERGEAGIAGFRTLSHVKNDSLMALTGAAYPIGGSRMPLDFPVELAKQLIDEFGNKGNILDPCHGWGGRLVGALLADVNSYTGVDPSPHAHNGVTKIKNAFQPYTKVNEINIIESPYEDTNLKNGYYDFALTSPPYFDVEKYEGEETSTNRYGNFDLWVEKFYTPLIKKTYEYLKSGGCFALQVRSQTYPLKEKAFEIGNKVGFVCSLYDVNVLPGAKTNTLHDTSEENSEVVVLMRKPNR